MIPELSTTAGLWLAVVLSGLYHGLNPGMGWPLAVSAGLMGDGRRDLLRALGPLALGHLLAMLLALAPFAILTGLIEWRREIQIAASLLLIGTGLYLLINRRHPRFLARIPPHRLALWSFAIAMAHGAGLMLAPIYLGICAAYDLPLEAEATDLVAVGLTAGLTVSLVHAAAMIAAGGAMAVAVHAWLGLKFISKTWLNLDAVWALSLILVGAIALTLAI